METLQANINDPGKNGEPEHKEEDHDTGTGWGLLLVHSRVDYADQALTFEDAGGGDQGAGKEDCPTSTACADEHREGRYHTQNEGFVQRPLEHCVEIFIGEVNDGVDRKSTRLNSSHLVISYAVFCL